MGGFRNTHEHRGKVSCLDRKPKSHKSYYKIYVKSSGENFNIDVVSFLQGKEPGRMIEAPVTKCDSGTQTDTHFMESNIVKSYEWNEWELRRKALKLVS